MVSLGLARMLKAGLECYEANFGFILRLLTHVGASKMANRAQTGISHMTYLHIDR